MGKLNQQKRAAKRKQGRGRRPLAEFWTARPIPAPDRLARLMLGAAHEQAHGQDKTAVERSARELSSGRFADQQRVVSTAAAMALGETLNSLWRAGWLPADLAEVISRLCGPPEQSLLADAVVADTARYSPATVDQRWTRQVAELGRGNWWDRDRPHLLQWAEQADTGFERALLGVHNLLAEFLLLPALPKILPLPGQATPGAAEASGVDQKVLTRVRGLLAKAESTQFPEEAEALSAKAQELMNRHAFERAVLDADTHHEQRATSIRMWLDNPYLEAKSYLVAAIAETNRCRSVFYAKLGFVALVGAEMDLEITELLSMSLLVQATRAMVAEGSQLSGAGTSRTRSFRRAFLLAYADRIGERLDKASAYARDAEEDKRLLPVLADRSRAVEETFAEMFAHTVRKSTSVTNGAGWQAGRAAADRADLNIDRKAVGA